MLTPEQIKKHNFRGAGKGLYRSDDVDAFLKEAAEAYAKTQESAAERTAELQKNNDELYQRVEALANALNQLRAERELIQKTMILAQKAAEDIAAKAQEESDRAVREAKAEAERLRRDSQAEASALLRSSKADVEKLLLEAQAQAENITAQAKARADSLFEEARSKAQTELIKISGEVQRKQQEFVQIRQQTSCFRGDLLSAVARQMELIEQMPDDDQESGEAKPVSVPQPQPKPQITLVKTDPEPMQESGIRLQEAGDEEPAAPEEPISGQDDMFADLEAVLDTEEGFRFVN